MRTCGLLVVLCVAGLSVETGAQPSVLAPGYTLTLISAGVSSENIAQLAFDPDDPTRLYAVHQPGLVRRYDYDAQTGILTNATEVANLGVQALGLGFHDGDLYVSLDHGGSIVERPGDGRITRLSDPDVNGVFQVRHDFVHSIDKGAHDVNQIQITGDTLYVGIGAVGRKGDPEEENQYTMSIARIVDLTQVDHSNIAPDFKGPINYLAEGAEWLDTTGTDGRLRYFASGFRNPFGLAIDADGDLWVSSNGNNDPGFVSPDFLYKKVPLGGQGVFPLDAFAFDCELDQPPCEPHVMGTPISPLVDLGISPSPTGFDFMGCGPDAGKVVMTQFGATAEPEVGRDVILIDPDLGGVTRLVSDFAAPIDVVRDSFGNLLIADYLDGSIWRLTPPWVSACCDNGDNDLDGLVDFPQDPGCALLASPRENPSCDDEVDNDGDGGIDWDGGSGGAAADSQCTQGFLTREARRSGWNKCGLGFELMFLAPLLARLGRRRR